MRGGGGCFGKFSIIIYKGTKQYTPDNKYLKMYDSKNRTWAITNTHISLQQMFSIECGPKEPIPDL